VSAFTRSTYALNVEADAVCALLDGGFLDLYDGVQPTGPDQALLTQTRLARLTFGIPAFHPSVGGEAVARAIGPDRRAAATGQATWFRARQSDEWPVCDGSIGLYSGAEPSNDMGAATEDLLLTRTAIQINAEVTVTSFIYRASRGR